MTPVTLSSSSLAKLLLPRLLSGLQLHLPTTALSTTTSSRLSHPPTMSGAESVSFPEPPKRPFGPYFRFTQDQYAHEMSTSPQFASLPYRKRLWHLAELWKALSEEQRAQYRQQHKRDSAEYAVKKEAWVRLLEEKDLMEKYQAKLKEKSQKKTYHKALADRRKAMEELSMPKRTRNAFSFFIMEEFKKASGSPDPLRETGHFKGGRNLGQDIKEMSQRFNALPPAQREALEKRREEDRKRYEGEMIEWQKDADKVRKWNEANDRVNKASQEMCQVPEPLDPAKAKGKNGKKRRKSV